MRTESQQTKEMQSSDDDKTAHSNVQPVRPGKPTPTTDSCMPACIRDGNMLLPAHHPAVQQSISLGNQQPIPTSSLNAASTAHQHNTKARFPLPELTGDRFPLPVKCTFPLAELTTRLVETGLYTN